jgi:hypothetical protein
MARKSSGGGGGSSGGVIAIGKDETSNGGFVKTGVSASPYLGSLGYSAADTSTVLGQALQTQTTKTSSNIKAQAGTQNKKAQATANKTAKKYTE